MIQYFKFINNRIIEVPSYQNDCWINISPPFNTDELKQLSEQLSIPMDFLNDSMDIDERPRFESEDNVKFIVIKTPILNDNSDNETDTLHFTVPIGIILVGEDVVTISPYVNPAIHSFFNQFIKNTTRISNTSFVLHLLEKNVLIYLDFLKELNAKRNQYETELYQSNRNEELLNLMTIQKSLVYFVTAIRLNELLMMKVKRTNFLKFNEEELEVMEDVLIDSSQALETANIYANILSGTMDAYASIINNNMNLILKRLTSITIILSLPALVAGFYGMNVHIPGVDPDSKDPSAFIVTIIISIGLSAVISWYFYRKKWF
jgi:magnesium transporter